MWKSCPTEAQGFFYFMIYKFEDCIGGGTEMEIACSKINNPSKATKYFRGIVWNKIRENE